MAAPVPKPYVPDEPVTAAPAPVKKTAAQTQTNQIQSLTKQRLESKSIPATKTATNKKTTTKQKAVEPKPVHVALNTTQRIKKTAKSQPKVSETKTANRIASRAATPVKTSVQPAPAKTGHKLALISGGPRLDSNAALVMNVSTGRMVYGKNAARNNFV